MLRSLILLFIPAIFCGYLTISFPTQTAFDFLSVQNEILKTGSEDSGLAKKLPDQVMALMDTSMEIMEWKEGLLNKDLKNDFIVALQSKYLRENYDKGSVDDKRTLMIFLSGSENNYSILCENPRIILCKRCGGQSGDPFAGINVRAGEVIIRHAGGADWKWQQEIVFKWNEEKSTFLLKKDETLSFNAATPARKKKVKTIGEGVIGQTIESFDIYVKR